MSGSSSTERTARRACETRDGLITHSGFLRRLVRFEDYPRGVYDETVLTEYSVGMTTADTVYWWRIDGRGNRRSTRAGDFWLQHPGTRSQTATEGRSSGLSVRIPAAAFADAYEREFVGRIPPRETGFSFFPHGSAPAFALALQDVSRVLLDASMSALRQQESVDTLVAQFVRLIAPHATVRPAPRLHPHQVSLVKRYIDEHLGEDLSVERLAARVGVSRYWFSRAFAGSVGEPPSIHVRRRRLEVALERLMAGSPVLGTAVDLGFSDQSHFTRVFRRHFGETPGRLRTRWQRLPRRPEPRRTFIVSTRR